MKLNYIKTISKSCITYVLETVDFTIKEDDAITAIGEPIVFMDKMYNGKFPVHIEKKIKTTFKNLRVKFDGSASHDDFKLAEESAEEFFNDLRDLLTDTMSDLIEKSSDFDNIKDQGTLNISQY